MLFAREELDIIRSLRESVGISDGLRSPCQARLVAALSLNGRIQVGSVSH